jgi:hypothetical protein
MPNVMYVSMSTGNVRLLFDTLSYVQIDIFLSPCHEVSNVSLICPMIGFDTILNYNFSHNFKLIGICKYNQLTITLNKALHHIQ